MVVFYVAFAFSLLGWIRYVPIPGWAWADAILISTQFNLLFGGVNAGA